MSPFKTPWSFFFYHFRFTTILILTISLFGLAAMVMMPKEASPEVKIPIAVVTTVFPGANAEDVEILVTTPLEDQIFGIQGVDQVDSSSSKGMSMITVQFDADEDITEKVNDLKSAVDRVQSTLPEDASDSVVQKIQLSDSPILVFGIGGPYDLVQVTEYAELIQDEIERVGSVSQVQILGGKDREIQVLVDKAALDGLDLNLSQVQNAIAQANTDIPVGFIETANEEFTLTLNGQLLSAAEVAAVPITSKNGALILVDDVAEVLDGFKEQRSLSRMSQNGEASFEAVTLRVFKTEGGDILRMVDEIQEKIETMESELLPEEIEVVMVEDNAKYIRQDLSSLLSSGVQTIVIVMFVLFLFLGWRESLMAGISIPLTFFITFICLSYLGYTLNSLTLFSLILSLGILVDAAIVITESISVKIEAKKTPVEAALETIREHQWPLVAGVMTTVFAFLPMLLTGGIMGEFIRSIPITVSIVLISSLFVSLALVTTLSIRLFKKEGHSWIVDRLNLVQEKKKKIEARVQIWYKGILDHYLSGKKAARRLYASLLLGFVLAMALPASGLLEVVMFPSSDNDTVYVNVSQPIGTPLSTTEKVVSEIETILLNYPEIEVFVSNLGSSSNSGSVLDGAALSDAHLANFVIQLDKERKRSSLEIVDELYLELTQKIDVELSVTQPTDGPGDAAPVEIRILGDDLSELDAVALQMEQLLEDIEGTRNIDNSLEDTNGEFLIEIDRQKAALYGVNIQQVAATLNSAISGVDASTLRVNGDDIDVLVKYDFDLSESSWDRKVDLAEVLGITMVTPTGDIPLSSFAQVNLDNSRSSVDHLDGDRIMRVSSYVETGVAPSAIFSEVSARLNELYLPDGVSIAMGGEQEDIQESFRDLARAFVLAVFLIAGLLVLQFNSYRQPLFILAAIPFALIGVMPGLFLMGQPLTFPAFIGIVALSGIVVNDAIILIDQINQNRLDGMEKTKAIKSAALSRLQPIVLTTVTTVCGMIPLALSSDTWGPLAYSIFFGLLFATVLTLLVIPVFYQQFGEKEVPVRHH